MIEGLVFLYFCLTLNEREGCWGERGGEEGREGGREGGEEGMEIEKAWFLLLGVINALLLSWYGETAWRIWKSHHTLTEISKVEKVVKVVFVGSCVFVLVWNWRWVLSEGLWIFLWKLFICGAFSAC